MSLFKSVISTSSTRDPKRHLVIVSVGSNIDAPKNISLSQDILESETQLLATADTIETKPVGYTQQPNFLNSAYLIETELTYDEFNQYLKSIEDRLKRKRGPIKSGPRTIDLDIIIWDGVVLTSDYHLHEYVSIPVNQLLSDKQISIQPMADASK